MRDHRIVARPAPAPSLDTVPPASRVRGLGLRDVLRIELDPSQIAGAIDELEERREPLRETFEQTRTRWDTLSEDERAAGSPRLEEGLSASAYALEVLTALRAQLPTVAHVGPVIFVGPACTRCRRS